MTHLLRHGVWVAICDGGKALLLENKGDGEFPDLVQRDVMEFHNPPARAQASSPAGRTRSSTGKTRSSHEQTDFHEQAERDFLRHFAHTLQRQAAEHGIKALVLIAPPRAMGMLRPFLTDPVRRILAAELLHDYTRMPLPEIERQLARLPING